MGWFFLSVSSVICAGIVLGAYNTPHDQCVVNNVNIDTHRFQLDSVGYTNINVILNPRMKRSLFFNSIEYYLFRYFFQETGMTQYIPEFDRRVSRGPFIRWDFLAERGRIFGNRYIMREQAPDQYNDVLINMGDFLFNHIFPQHFYEDLYGLVITLITHRDNAMIVHNSRMGLPRPPNTTTWSIDDRLQHDIVVRHNIDQAHWNVACYWHRIADILIRKINHMG